MAQEAGWVQRKKPMLAHDALADSIFQSEAVCAIYKHMGIDENGIFREAARVERSAPLVDPETMEVRKI